MGNEVVELIFRIKAEGQNQLNAIRQAVAGVTVEVKKEGEAAATTAAANKGLAGSEQAVAAAATASSTAHEKNSESMAVSIAKGALYNQVLNQVVNAVKSATVESALYAARTQQLNVVMDQLSRTNGLGVQSVRAQADAVRSLGITTQESRSTINQMIFAQLDLTKATDLARLAQNAAKIAGVSSSEALNGIIAGIVEQRIQMLRTYGIQVSFEQAFIRGAAAMGKSKETLTDFERANLALNEVLSKSPRILGTYEVSLTTAAGQMQSMQRNIDEARNSLGEGFIPVLQRIVSLMSDSTKSIQENAGAYQDLARHITSASLAIGAAKMTPGGPAAKVGVGAAVGIASEIFLNVDAVEQQIAFAKTAMEKIESNRRALAKQFKDGKIADQVDYLKEDERLKGLELQIERNLTESLAVEYKKRQDAAGKGGYALKFGGDGFPIKIGRTSSDRGLFQDDRPATPPDAISIGGQSKITRKAIEEAIGQIGKPPEINPDELVIKPNLSSQVDALLGTYTARVKEATKSAQGGLDRARESGLSGEDKIEQQRRDALAKVAEEFKAFSKTFSDTLKKAGEVEDPRERKELVDTIRSAQAQYGSIVGRINQQYNLEIQRERRNAQVDEIARGRKVGDAQSDVDVQSYRQRITQAQGLQRAKLADKPGLDGEEKLITQTYADRLLLAQKERDVAAERSSRDLGDARRIFELNKDGKAIKDAISAKAVADVKAEAQLLKEKSDAEFDKQVQILELRRKQRAEMREAYESAAKIAETERGIISTRAKDDRDRNSRLIQAQTLPGNEGYAIRNVFNNRVQAAREEYAATKEDISARRAVAYEIYKITKDGKELEKTSVELRVRELQAAYKIEKDIADARVEREIEIANIRKQQTEELRRSLGTLYDALKANGGGGFKDFLQGYYDQIKKTLFVNIGEELFRGSQQRLGGIIGGQEKVDPVTGKGTGELTTLGRILRGTPLGVDPAKLAMDRQVNAQDRNTRAIDTLTGVITGTNGSIGAAGGQGTTGALGRALGTIFGGNQQGGLVIKNLLGGNQFASGGPQTGGIDFRPDYGGTGFLNSVGGFFRPKTNAAGQPVFSAGQTALAAASAIPQILGGIDQGGLGGGLGVAGGALGIAASVPGPQQPFLQAGALALSLLGGLLGKNKLKEKQKMLDDRLSQRFSMPNSISLTQDLAGNSVDYDMQGNLRTYRGTGGATTNINVSVSTMDARSFMDNGPMIAESVRNQFQLNHPIRTAIGDAVGLGS